MAGRANYSSSTDTFVNHDIPVNASHSQCDLDAIGKHCMMCNLRDFLPLTCLICNITLCRGCNSKHTSACEKKTSPPTSPASSSTSALSTPEKKKKSKCGIAGCKGKVMSDFQCLCECEKRFCVEYGHWQPMGHDCPKERQRQEIAKEKRRMAGVIFDGQLASGMKKLGFRS
jgi:hypothetical protein